MAKSLRSRSKKINKQKLRSKVFGPVEAVRKERLSNKLKELAVDGPSDVTVPLGTLDSPSTDTKLSRPTERTQADAMQLDNVKSAAEDILQRDSRSGRVEKRRSKSKSSIVFPLYRQKQSRRARGKR